MRWEKQARLSCLPPHASPTPRTHTQTKHPTCSQFVELGQQIDYWLLHLTARSHPDTEFSECTGKCTLIEDLAFFKNVDHFKVFVLLHYRFRFMFLVLASRCEILIPQPGIRPAPPALEGKVTQPLDRQGRPWKMWI